MKLASRFIPHSNTGNYGRIAIILIAILVFSLISQAYACDVWTDKKTYNRGEFVTFFYSTNANCNVKITVIYPDGSQHVVLNEPTSPGQHQFPGQAWEPCGTRRVTIDVSCNGGGGNGSIPILFSNSGNSNSCHNEYTFDVSCPPSPPPSYCTETYRCNNNVVQRLCYENGNEYWKDYDNCNNHNQPCDCINGVCVEKIPTPPPKTCDQQSCQAQNGPVGQPYTLNGIQYQRYMDCNCVGGSCQCNQVEKQVSCSGIVSGGVIDEKGMPLADVSVSIQCGGVSWSGTTDNTGAFRSLAEFCPSTAYEATADKQGCTPNKVDGVTDVNGNTVVTIPITSESLGDVKFRGEVLRGGADESAQIISFYHFAIKVNEILRDPQNRLTVGAIVGVSSSRSGPAKVEAANNGDSVEVYGKCVSQGKVSTTYYSYNSNVQLSESISDGAQYYLIELKPKCSGTISGHVKDANSNSPIPGATLLICPSGGDCWSTASTDSTGLYSSGGQACPSTSHEITCSAEGFKSSTLTVTTDASGNAQQDFTLEPECKGTIYGKVLDANNNHPIPNANLLICQKGKCFDPIITDSSGHYSLQGTCPSTDFDITCSADGYKNKEETGPTDDKGNWPHDIKMEPESKLKEIKFNGTLYRSNAPMGFAVYYFKVDKILEGENIQIGDPVGVDIYDDTNPLGSMGSCDMLQEGDKAEVYASINTDSGKKNDGYETAWSARITEDKKYYVKKLSQNPKGSIILSNPKFTDYLPAWWDEIMRNFFGAHLEVDGKFDATLEPEEKIKNANVEVKLGCIGRGHLSIFAKEAKNIFDITDGNAIPDSLKQYVKWETKNFDLTDKNGVYSAELSVDATAVTDIFQVLYMVCGGSEEIMNGILGKGFPLKPDPDTYLTGDEPVYLYAKITKITVTDTSGNQLDFPIDLEIKTYTHKKVVALEEDTQKKIEQAIKEGHINDLMPPGIPM